VPSSIAESGYSVVWTSFTYGILRTKCTRYFISGFSGQQLSVSSSKTRITDNGTNIYVSHSGRNLFLQGNCDPVFLALIHELGWVQDIEHIIDDLAALVRHGQQVKKASHESVKRRRCPLAVIT
jgi:hypothetical protein